MGQSQTPFAIAAAPQLAYRTQYGLPLVGTAYRGPALVRERSTGEVIVTPAPAAYANVAPHSFSLSQRLLRNEKEYELLKKAAEIGPSPRIVVFDTQTGAFFTPAEAEAYYANAKAARDRI